MVDVITYADGVTALSASPLNTAVPAATHLMSGTTPGTSASLTLSYGTQKAVIRDNHLGVDGSTTIAFVTLNSGTVAVTDNATNWIYLKADGTLYTPIPTGTSQPTTPDNTMPLWKVVASGGTIGTAPTSIAPTNAVSNSALPPAITITEGIAAAAFTVNGYIGSPNCFTGDIFIGHATTGLMLDGNAQVGGTLTAAKVTGSLTQPSVSAGSGASVPSGGWGSNVTTASLATNSGNAGQFSFSVGGTPQGSGSRLLVLNIPQAADIMLLSPAAAMGSATIFAAKVTSTQFNILADNAVPVGSYSINYLAIKLAA